MLQFCYTVWLHCSAVLLPRWHPDLRVEEIRFEAVQCIVKSYRPSVSVAYISSLLKFSEEDREDRDEEDDDDEEEGSGEEEGAVRACAQWLRAHGATLVESSGEGEGGAELVLDCKVSG